MSTFVDGVGASENIDSTGERIIIAGMDISSLAVDGIANWEHKSDNPDQIVGKVLKAKKIFSEKDCEDERQTYFWSKTGVPFVYVLIELFDDYKESAKEVAGMFRYDQDKKGQNEKNVMNFSIEGAKIEKKGIDIVKSIARKVTITPLPANKAAIAEMVPANKNKKDDIDSLFKTETNVEIELIKSEDMGELLAKITKSVNSRIPPKPPENKGSLLGSTKSGKEVHSHERIHNYKNFTQQDHKDASALHHESMLASKDSKTTQHHTGKKMLHLQAAGSSERRETRMASAKSTVKSGTSGPDKIETSVLRPYAKVDNLPAPIKKTMTAGSGMGSPGTLTGGAALAKQDLKKEMAKQERGVHLTGTLPTEKSHSPGVSRMGRMVREGDTRAAKIDAKNTTAISEKIKPNLAKEEALAKQCIDPKMHKGCTHDKMPKLTKSEEVFALAKDQYNNWNKKDQFVEFMSARMPKMTKSEIDVFGATMLLKKNMESENALESLIKSDPCWTGYKKVPGKKEFSKGSCAPIKKALKFGSEADQASTAKFVEEQKNKPKAPKTEHKPEPELKGRVKTEVSHVEKSYSTNDTHGDTVHLKSGHKVTGVKNGTHKVGDKVTVSNHAMGARNLESGHND